MPGSAATGPSLCESGDPFSAQLTPLDFLVPESHDIAEEHAGVEAPVTPPPRNATLDRLRAALAEDPRWTRPCIGRIPLAKLRPAHVQATKRCLANPGRGVG